MTGVFGGMSWSDLSQNDPEPKLSWEQFVDQVLRVDAGNISGKNAGNVVRTCILSRSRKELTRSTAYVLYHLASMLEDVVYSWSSVVAACGWDPGLKELKEQVLREWNYSIPFWMNQEEDFDVRSFCLDQEKMQKLSRKKL